MIFEVVTQKEIKRWINQVSNVGSKEVTHGAIITIKTRQKVIETKQD